MPPKILSFTLCLITKYFSLAKANLPNRSPNLLREYGTRARSGTCSFFKGVNTGCNALYIQKEY